ncbi:MAG TPA: aldehyde dehydrogenase [Alphaproteobacteria bacterium]|nr:aldehyde dehydrogenase [Alphaproteobacteria bacterium]
MPGEMLRHDKLFVGGEWVSPVDGEVVPSIDPSTGEAWATAAFAGKADVERAVDAANEALKSWKKTSPTERANLLRKLGDLYAANAGRLAELESRDNGMPIRDSRAGIAGHAQYYYYYAGLADQISGRAIPVDSSVHVYTSREPVGVVGAITPWNAPLQTVMWKLAPALAAGCAIIVKTAEQTPITAYELAKLCAEAGIPKGVVSVVPGWGETAGAALVEHPRVNKISFTGEHRTAQMIMRGAAVNLKRLSFECGGKSPHIIFDDADLGQAINAATHSSFALCGQSCALGSRLFVHDSIYDKVVEEIAARSQRVRVGSALDPATQMGPQAHEEQYRKTLRYFDIGRSEGARLVAGGSTIDGLGNGYFVKPTVFADVTNDMQIARDEIFGPVVGVLRFKTEDEVLAMANQTDYGLVAGVWTQNVGRAHRVAAQLQAGMVWVNTYRYIRYKVPYGGFKMSGLNRENGPEGLDPYLETKSTIINLTGNYPDAYAQ